MNPTLLIDADFFFYRAAQASEQEQEYSPDLTVIVGDFHRGKQIVEQELNKFRTKFDTDDLILFFTDKKNFRKGVDENYKGNRTKRKPCGYLKLKNWGLDKYPSLIMPNLEADDALGIAATSGEYKNFVLISPDKDMQQIPCRIYDLKNEYTQTPELAERRLYEQCLTGDSTDGYSGAPGFGPKRADLALRKVKTSSDYWPCVVEAYESVGCTEEDALRNLRLARILQSEDWDAEKQEPILITPDVSIPTHLRL
jgi:5'-3' exonuclease